MYQSRVVCLTDLADSTNTEEEKGSAEYEPLRREFLQSGAILAEISSGHTDGQEQFAGFGNGCEIEKRFLKNTGDGHLIRFDDIEAALAFATSLQQLFAAQPGLQHRGLRPRISLSLGTVWAEPSDIFGQVVNRTARQAGVTPPEDVCLNSELEAELRKMWGPKADVYLSHLGNFQYKGLKDPLPVFTLDWQRYSKEYPEITLAGHIYRCLENAGIELSNLSIKDLVTPGLIIWPAVPRRLVTAIHRGQIEIIRLLAMLGWRILLLIGDCGTKETVGLREKFRDVTKVHCNSRRLAEPSIRYLSEMFSPDLQYHRAVIKNFQQTTAKLTVQDLIEINQKEYAANIRANLPGYATLDFLRPVFTFAAMLDIAQGYRDQYGDVKCILIAGADEKRQWERFLEVADDKWFGAALHPALCVRSSGTGETNTVRQNSDWPIWRSQKALIDEISLKDSNAGKWIFQLHALLREFPSQDILLDQKKWSPRDWADNEFTLPPGFPAKALAAKVWGILDPN